MLIRIPNLHLMYCAQKLMKGLPGSKHWLLIHSKQKKYFMSCLKSILPSWLRRLENITSCRDQKQHSKLIRLRLESELVLGEDIQYVKIQIFCVSFILFLRSGIVSLIYFQKN